MIKYFSVSIAFSLSVLIVAAQQTKPEFPFIIRLEQMEINNMPALQSFAYATWQGKWLMIGGRKDGLHRRQPWATFDEEGQNRFIYVVDPQNKKVWKQMLENLPTTVIEQLQSTNMGFCQTGNRLFLTGGYGYSKTADDHITFPYITVIKVDELITAMLNNKDISNSIVQIKDERMAVTGGRLAKLRDTFLLAGGQRFDGRYNPHGPDHGPGFKQEYSNEIRKFTIEYDKETPAIKNYAAINDSINLHRRDYNLVPQVFKNDELGYTMFSGVFQYNQDIPFTNFVDIAGGTYKVNNSFEQKFSHYHTAVMPLYDKISASMYTVFFGGIARYYPDKNGKTVDNKEVPFTKTISVVIRKDEKEEEIFLPIQMPGYLGAAAEFIFMPDSRMYMEGIADAGSVQHEENFIGYIVGGINSSANNIFFDNTGKESKASSKIIKVFIKKTGG
ncbi:MAG: T9SS C-terminal target domain-containing protein [Chitinophagaceae bacterium]|nr:T9SS C-terminal target domain-containing protein [Chitinophagaceae bacterium]